MREIIQLLQDNVGTYSIILVVASMCIEISPIKFNPISTFLNWLGRKMNGELWKKIDDLDSKFDQLTEDVDTNRAEQIRWEILDFANTCRNQKLHSKDEFTHIMKQHTKYEELIKKRGLENGIIDEEYKYITELYNKCSHENNFL